MSVYPDPRGIVTLVYLRGSGYEPGDYHENKELTLEGLIRVKNVSDFWLVWQGVVRQNFSNWGMVT